MFGHGVFCAYQTMRDICHCFVGTRLAATARIHCGSKEVQFMISVPQPAMSQKTRDICH